jgi:preprotein translocase subunit SecE
VSVAKSGTWRDNKIIRYFRETRVEMRKVHWPTRNEAWNLTKIVIGVTVAMAALLGALDYLFALELGGLVAGSAIAIGVLAVLVVAVVVVTVLIRRQASR